MALKTVIANSKTKSPFANHLECRVCKQRFYTTGNLIDHMSTHKHFLLHCNICNKGFSDQKNLDEHYLTHKEVTNTFDCPQCEKKFLQKYQLEYHMQFHAILTPVSKTTPHKKKTLSFTSFHDSSNSDSEYALDADTSEDYKPPTKKVKNAQRGRRVKDKNMYEESSESEEFASDDSRYDSMLPQKTKSGRTVKRKKFFGSEPKTKRRRKNCEEYLDAEENDDMPGCNKTSKKQTVKKCEKAGKANPSPTTPVDNDMTVNTLLEKKKRDQIAHKNYLLSKKQAKNKCMKFIDGDFSAENERTLIGFKKKMDKGEHTKRKYNKKSNEKIEALCTKRLENFSQGPSLKSRFRRRMINEAFSRYELKLQQSSNFDQEETHDAASSHIPEAADSPTPEAANSSIPEAANSPTPKAANPPTPEAANSLQFSQNFNLKKFSIVLEKIPETIYSKYAEKANISSNNNQVKCPEKSNHTRNLLSNTKTFPVNISVNAKTVPVNKPVNVKTVPINKPINGTTVPINKPVSSKTVLADKPVSVNQKQNHKTPIKISQPELKKSTPTTTQIAINVINHPSGIDREFLYVGPQQDYNKITSVINEMESMSSNKNTAGSLLSKSLQNTRNTQNANSSNIVSPTERSRLSNDKLANTSQKCEQGVLEKKFIKDFVFVKVTREYMEKIQQEKSDLLIKHGSVEPSASNATHTVKTKNLSANLSQVKPAKEILPLELTEKVVEQNTKPDGLSSQSVGTGKKSHTSPSKSSRAFGSSNPLTNASSEANNAESLQTSHVKDVVTVNTVLGNQKRVHTADSIKNCKTAETNSIIINSEINVSPVQKKTPQSKKIEFDKAKSISVDKNGNSIVTHFLKVISPKKQSVDKNNKTIICHSSKNLPELSQNESKITVKSNGVSSNVQTKNHLEDSQSKPFKVTITNLDTGVEQSLEHAISEMKTNTGNAAKRKSKDFQHAILNRANALCLENKTIVSNNSNSKQTYHLKKSTNKDTEAKLKNSPGNKMVSELSQKVSKANNLCEATTSSQSKLLVKNTEANAKNSPTSKSTVKNIEAKSKDCRRSKTGLELSPKVSAIDNSKETIKTSAKTNVNLKESENVPTKQVTSVNSKTNEKPKDKLEESEDLQGEMDAKIESNSSQVVSPMLSEKVLLRYKEKMEEKERKKREKYELKKKLRIEEKIANSPDKTCLVKEESEKLTLSKDVMHSPKSKESCTVDKNKISRKNHIKDSKSNSSQLTVDVSQQNSVTEKVSTGKDKLKSDKSDDVAKQQSKVKVAYAIRFSPKSQAQHEKLKSKPCKSSDEEAIEKAYEISLKFQKCLSENECLKLLDELDSLTTNFNISKKCPFLFTIIRFCRLYIDSYKVKEQAISLHTKLTKDLL